MSTPINRSQIERQDYVDGTIHDMLEQLAGCELPWNIEVIAIIRDMACEFVCETTGQDRKEFYWFERFSDMFSEE